MMQEILVFAIVLAAATYLFFTVRASMRGKSSCGSCKSAEKKRGDESAPLVQITMNGRTLKSPASTRSGK